MAGNDPNAVDPKAPVWAKCENCANCRHAGGYEGYDPFEYVDKSLRFAMSGYGLCEVGGYDVVVVPLDGRMVCEGEQWEQAPERQVRRCQGGL